MIASLFVSGFFAMGALFSNGMNQVNHAGVSAASFINWGNVGEISTGVSLTALAISGTCALTIAVNEVEV